MPQASARFSPTFWFGAVMIAILTMIMVAQSRTPVEKVPWRTDYPAAMADAAKTNKPILLDFSATWCGPCQEMKRSTWSDADVAKALAGNITISIDPDKNPDLVRQYHVQAFPTMILLSPTGMPLNETAGYLDPDDFLAWLRSPTPFNTK